MQDYDVPKPPVLTRREEKQITYFRLHREQIHDSPLYAAARTRQKGPSYSTRAYGQEDINRRYRADKTAKANVDPFLAIPSYSERFSRTERTLPDLGSHPFAKEFFPKELHAALEGQGGTKRAAKVGRKVLALSSIKSLRTAEEIFYGDATEGALLDDPASVNRSLNLVGHEDEDGPEDEFEDEDLEAFEDDADQFEDESENDYNAEQYFDGNQDEDDYHDGGGGDDGGDTY
jgi:DNA-directed RNA polymerase III subunit RPC7